MIPNPQNISFNQWGAILIEELSVYNIANVPSEDLWISWAQSVVDNPDLESQGLPRPEVFSDWRGWASRICQALQ